MSASNRTSEPSAIGVRELKANLSQVLKRVQAGERVTITHHGTRIVDLAPAAETAAEELTLAAALAKLERKFGTANRFDVSRLEPF